MSIMSEMTVQGLIDALERFPRPENRADRARLREAISAFNAKIKDEDVLQHEIVGAPLQLVIPRIASDLNIFECLVNNQEPVSTDDLVAETKADKTLLVRILRYLASQKYISSPSPHLWASSSLTPFLANPSYAAGLRFGTSCILPAIAATPALLSENGFQDITKYSTTAFQRGNPASESLFEWLGKRPKEQTDFQDWMAETLRYQVPFFTILPLDEIVTSATCAETPLFVDVGGGNGQTCMQVREKYPAMKGRVINQDLQATTIGLDSPSQGIEHQDYDFLTPQPVRGARVYHVRNVLHNWSDENCIEILRRTSEAMDRDSVLVVDSGAISDTEPNWYDCYLDLIMGMFFGARVRTVEEHRGLMERAGLVLQRDLGYGEGKNQRVFVCRRSGGELSPGVG